MSEKINVEKVEKELVSALAADRKYSRENDAKIRAITQRVATYDEFREIVKGSHLTPLEKKDTRGGGDRFHQPWNPVAGSGGREAEEEEEEQVDFQEAGREMNIQSFMRLWKKLVPGTLDQYRFLMGIQKEVLSQLFRIEISMGLLGEILIVLNENFTEEDRKKVFDVLHILSHSLRFKLSLDFLTKSEREACMELMGKLRVSWSQEDTSYLSTLSQSYRAH